MTLRNELKANEQSVETTLGGGAHGHLGLVVPPAIYITIAPDTPYIKPRQPTIQLLERDSQYILAEKRHNYDRQLHVTIGATNVHSRNPDISIKPPSKIKKVVVPRIVVRPDGVGLIMES